MADNRQLPHVRQSVVDSGGTATQPWAAWFQRVNDALTVGQLSDDDATAAIRLIALALGSPDGAVEDIPAQAGAADVEGINPVLVYGSIADGLVRVGLVTEADSGVGAALVKITRDEFGRVEGTEAATTDDLTEGATNLYYADALADARVAAGIAAFQAAPSLGALVNAVDDAAAATAGVPIGSLYRNASALMIRVA